MQRRSKFIMCILCVLCALSGIYPVRANAASQEAEALPKIVRWENGNGYEVNGNMIKESWAYDTVNDAGKYVLFNEMGSVLLKTDDWSDKENVMENFTSTEQETATIAFRGEVLHGFDGEVTVRVTEKSGVQSSYLLNQNNSYLVNAHVNSGSYTIQAEVYDKKYVYATEYPTEQFEMQEKGLLLVKIKMTSEIIGEVKENHEEKKIGAEKQNDGQQENPRKVEKEKEESLIMETGIKKYMLCLCGGVLVGLVLYLLLRNRRNKYN